MVLSLNKTILLVGAAGSGKTWAVKHFLGAAEATVQVGKFRGVYNQELNLIVAGVYDGSMFEGSDKLSMSIMTDYTRFKAWQENNDVILLCEGDRFSNSKFISLFQPTIIKILDDGAEGIAKRGSQQTERHLKSIKTRVSNINATIEVYNSSEAVAKIIGLL